MGFEPTTDAHISTGKRAKHNARAAKCAAHKPAARQFDDDLASIIDAWPTLPEAMKAGIVAIVKASPVKDDLEDDLRTEMDL